MRSVYLKRLVEAYQHFGFSQVVGDPFMFENAEREIYFHSEPTGKRLELEFVIEDIALWNPCFAETMRAYLEQISNGDA